jgi:hypothetical protein
MKKIGILFGMENTFPPAVVERINRLCAEHNIRDVQAEFVQVGGVRMAAPSGYRVIIDRISQDIPFYRAMLKNAALSGTLVVNNPFWWTADDKFFNYALMSRLGVAIPHTVLLPHHEHPPDTTDRSMRNLQFPLDWDAIFDYVGFPAFLKPYSGGGWKHVYKVNSPEELFHAYNQTGQLCMTLQAAVDFQDYYRCYAIGLDKIHVMKYDPKAPHHERYVKDNPPAPAALQDRMVRDARTICHTLGYEINTIEFAVQDGVPYAIDFLNPAPDADVNSVGPENFEWFVQHVAEFAIAKAQSAETSGQEMRWSAFLHGASSAARGR